MDKGVILSEIAGRYGLDVIASVNAGEGLLYSDFEQKYPDREFLHCIQSSSDNCVPLESIISSKCSYVFNTLWF